MTTGSVPNLIRIANGSEDVDLDRVYREHAGRVSRWVRRLSGSQDVSDTLQEVFEVAQRRLSSFRGDAQLTTWLYGITVRVVSSRRRKARLRQLLFLQARTDLEPEAVETPAESLDKQRATRLVYSVLDALSERDRTLLILFELERLEIADIAAILAMNENSVAVALHRARERFRVQFRKRYPDEARGGR